MGCLVVKWLGLDMGWFGHFGHWKFVEGLHRDVCSLMFRLGLLC